MDLPRFAVLHAVQSGGYVNFLDETGSYHGQVRVGDGSVYDPLARIEIEEPKEAKYCNKYVHLRFCHTNKYWSCLFDNMVFARLDRPNEDVSDPSCTLFEPKIIDKRLYLIHVQSKRPVSTPRGLYLENGHTANFNDENALVVVDCDELLELPKFVAFKGDNGKYLKSAWIEGQPYLTFSSADPNLNESAHQIFLTRDGHIRIKSVYFDKFWRRGPDWILADSSDDSDPETRFWPVRLSGKISLRSAGKGNFCRRLSGGGKADCLSAAAETAAREARFELEELVDERQIYNLKFKTEYARIFDETPYAAGTAVAVNDREDREMNVAVKLAQVVSNSYTFSKSLSASTSFKSTISVEDLIQGVQGSFEFSFAVTGTFAWSETTTETSTVEATGTVTVPTRSKATVRCVGTRRKCNVPFSYRQRDKSSTDGRFDASEHTDGIFTGVSFYNFTFHVVKIEPL